MALQPRPAVVTIMGHVDHGKTSLLDSIRKARVAAGEAGGITQHIGAYQAMFDGKLITFIDTPGHAAFSKMRSRGAATTDIVVLVVAADDGVKPQTIESIQHIQKANVPYVVAINKIDAMGANPETVKAQLTEHSVFVTGYGGNTDVIPVSAKTGEGIDALLETLILSGEVLELQADPEAPFEGVVIESSKDKFLGSTATVLVRNGSLSPRQKVYVGESEVMIRTLTDSAGQSVKTAGPSMPVLVTGFTDVPAVGSVVTAQPVESQPVQMKNTGPSFADETLKLKLIVKADFAGTLEAVVQSLENNEHISVLGTGIGDVMESDLQLAETVGATVITFQTKASGAMKKLAKHLGVSVREYRIIYELLEDMEKRVDRLLKPEKAEKIMATTEVLQIFNIRGQQILGCAVKTGVLRKGQLVHLMRNDQVVADGAITSLKQGKSDVESVTDEQDCGVVLAKPVDALVGDQLIAFELLGDDE